MRLRENFAAIGPAQARLAQRPAVCALLDCLGGNSPYLAGLALREAAALRDLLRHGPDATLRQALARLAAMPPHTPRPRLAAALREAKRVVALTAAIADIGGVWSLAEVTAALSDLAEAALRLAVAHLLGESGLAGFCVLGMGKLGARELNYSSDIDLVLLFDPAANPHRGATLGQDFVRLARALVGLLQDRTGDGYVFRTDLRLRPDPAATPLAVALPAALAYYESMGQSWERAAMIKARPVAGDLALGAQFLAAIRSFVWRRHLDFAALADIHAMKRRIDAHGPLGGDALLGRDLKRGPGGIREIEFLAQALQLVWGGRDSGLRAPQTLEALAALAAAGHLPAARAEELAAAYRLLRRIEHRLQMVDDRQTHSLPERAAALAGFARFLDLPDAEALGALLLPALERVAGAFAGFFEAVPQPDARLLQPAALADLGFAEPVAAAARIARWLGGEMRALRTPRARDLLAGLLPALLAALARQAQPDAALARADAFLGRLPAGVAVLSLFQRNPLLLDRIAAVLGAAPSLADHLAQVPAALEGLLRPEEAERPRAVLRAALAEAAGLEESIAALRRSVREAEFRLSVATLEGRMDADAAGIARATLAEAALAALLPRLLADHARRFGRLRGGGMAVVLLGRAGAREMMAGSDLDLLLIYDHPVDVIESRLPRGGGGRALPASQWFIRAAHALVAALTAAGPEGPLYAVDMRLRPSGSKGPVAVSLAGFARYHAESAWTWERMALTRARVVAGPAALRARVASAIGAALAAGDPARIGPDAAAMRARLAQEMPAAGVWDIKHRDGGLMEVAFIVETLRLRHGLASPSTSTRGMLRRLAAAGAIGAGDAATLGAADVLYRNVIGLLRITLGAAAGATLPAASARPLLAATGAVDVADLVATLDRTARAVRALFERLVGPLGDGAQKEGRS